MGLRYFRWLFLCYRLFSVLSVKALSTTECTFKESFCGWQNTTGSWDHINAVEKTEAQLPSARPNSDGYYVATDNYAKLTSPELNAGLTCISLWYYLSSKDCLIKVTSEKSKTTLKYKDTDNWQHILINVNPSKKHEVEIEGTFKNNNDEYIAVDDILITTGTTCTADCTFDDGWCAWEPENVGPGKWTRHRGSDNGGPFSDHTKGDGYYIFKDSGSTSRVSVSHEGGGDICLTMWYFIHGDNKINIYVKTHTDVERLEHTIHKGEDKWTKVQIQYLQHNIYELIIEGVIGYDNEGDDDTNKDISIDDITVTQGVCEQDNKTGSMVVVYVVVPLAIVIIAVAGIVAYIVWRKRRAKRKQYPGEAQQSSTIHPGHSFSNNAYMGHRSEPNNQLKSVPDDNEYAVIGDDNVNMSADKAEYNVLNTTKNEQHEREFGYDRLKQSLTPFVNKSYSHVSNNSQDNDNQKCEEESSNRKAHKATANTDESQMPKFPFEADDGDDLDIDYDHAQSGAADARKSDGYSHLNNAGGINHTLDTGKMFTGGNIQNNKQEIHGADDNVVPGECDESEGHDYFILQNEETV